MYIGNQHTATTTVTKILEYSCSQCGKKSIIAVTGIGQGKGNSPYFTDESGAAERSVSRAQRAALKNAYDTAAIARCPRCGKTDRAKVIRFWSIQWAKILGGTALLLLVGLFLYNLDNEPIALVISGAMALVYIPFIYFLDIRWRWNTKDKRVRLYTEVPD